MANLIKNRLTEIKNIIAADAAVSSSNIPVFIHGYKPEDIIQSQISRYPIGILLRFLQIDNETFSSKTINGYTFNGQIEVIESPVLNNQSTNYTSSLEIAEEVFGAIFNYQLTTGNKINPVALINDPNNIKDNKTGVENKKDTVKYIIKYQITEYLSK